MLTQWPYTHTHHNRILAFDFRYAKENVCFILAECCNACNIGCEMQSSIYGLAAFYYVALAPNYITHCTRDTVSPPACLTL